MPSIYLSASTQQNNVGIDGITEETRMQSLVGDVERFLVARGLTVYRNNPAWSLGEIIEDSNRKKPDLHIAFHSNAYPSGSGKASGVETWCYKASGTKSAEFGTKLQDAVIRAIGLPNRGIKDATAPGQSLSEVKNTHATAVLIELFFHDNQGDVAAFKHNRQAVIDAIVKVILEWFGVTPARVDHPTAAMDFAVAEGWIKERRNPHAMPTWWELIDFMRNVQGTIK